MYDRSVYMQGRHYASVKPTANWKPPHKENQLLTQLDATIANYSDWAQTIADHLARTNRGWFQLLCYTEKLERPVTYEFLSVQHIGGVNSWDFSCHLETLLVAWISKTLR